MAIHSFWTGLPGRETLRSQAVQALLGAADPDEQRVAAAVVAQISVLELPDGWKELFPGLLGVLDNTASTAHMRRGVLTTVAFIAEEVEEHCISPAVVNKLLTHCVAAMAPDQPDRWLMEAGMRCLANLLEFCEAIFTDDSRKGERGYLVNVFVSAAGHKQEEIRVLALRGLANMVRWYYPAMPEYMAACHSATDKVIKAIEDDFSRDGSMALEFWAGLGDKEQDLEEGANFHLLRRIVDTLAPSIWEVITTKRDGAEEIPTVMQTEAKPAHVASEVMRQMIFSLEPRRAAEVFTPLIDGSFTHADWRVREGAISVLGYMAEAFPAAAEVAPLIGRYYPLLMGRLTTSADAERDHRIRPALAWCAGVILDSQFETVAVVNGRELVSPSIAVFGALLSETPVTARYGAFALSALASKAAESPRPPLAGSPGGTAWITPDLARTILGSMMRAMGRSDGHLADLITNVMDAFSYVTNALGTECLPLLLELVRGTIASVPPVGTKFVGSAAGSAERQLVELQLTALCGSLGVLVGTLFRLGEDAGPAAAGLLAEARTAIDGALPTLIHVVSLKDCTATMEAWIALSTVVTSLEAGVAKHVATLGPVLVTAIKNHTDSQSSIKAIMATSAFISALGDGVAACIAPLFEALQEVCMSDEADRFAKPEAVGCIGDLAIAAGPDVLTPYIGHISTILATAERAPLIGDVDEDDWTFKLRENILSTYSGLLNAFQSAPHAQSEHWRGAPPATRWRCARAPRKEPWLAPPRWLSLAWICSRPRSPPTCPTPLLSPLPLAESVVVASGQQAIRLVKRLAAEIGTMSETQRSELSGPYLCNMCMVVA